MKRIISLCAALSMLFVLYFSVSAASPNTSESTDVTSARKFYNSKAFQIGDQEFVKKYGGTSNGKNGHLVKLKLNQPLSLSFGDGSSITYVLTETTVPLGKSILRVNPLDSSTTTKTLTVENVQLFWCVWLGRYISEYKLHVD